VGFVMPSADAETLPHAGADLPAGVTRVLDVIGVSGPAAGTIRSLLAGAWVAADFGTAGAAAAAAAPGTVVATLQGHVFQGASVVEGGVRTEARGILATKREIKELRERALADHTSVDRLRSRVADIDVTIASAESAILSLQGELHRQEKSVVGFELQLNAAREAVERITRKQAQIATERRAAEEEQRTQQARQDEARESIVRIETEQKSADGALNQAQRRLFEAREAMQAQAHRAAQAKATHAALVERAGAAQSDVERLEQACRDLEERLRGRADELQRNEARREQLQESVASATAFLDTGLREFDGLRERVRALDEQSQTLRGAFDRQDVRIREARREVEAVRNEVAQFDVARATAEADLGHLAQSCADTVQATLDEVAAEVLQLKQEGLLSRPKADDDAPDAAEVIEDESGELADAESAGSHEPAERTPASSGSLTPDEMVADLRARIDRMGPVNMMAIDQFDDLESRHAFLTAQRKDLVDSIAATTEAIRRIDKTTKERFREAFAVINQNFEHTFTTLFGGGRAGLVLLDESDQLESGIDIIAQPPGKRLQSVQLLSGGEKALTAMALMFAIFKYRPSPFCLLDEIDAPLDDANIGRFVEMLQGMQEHTQFILITHNRKTMEIADQLYGVTMEEPGVSKLISVQLN
jgi:chromosome segregation protein